MMNVDEIKKFPSLENHQLVMNGIDAVRKAKISLTIKEAELHFAIDDIQKDCLHVWKEETGNTGESKIKISRFKRNGNTNYSMTVIDSRICVLCGLHKEKSAN